MRHPRVAFLATALIAFAGHCASATLLFGQDASEPASAAPFATPSTAASPAADSQKPPGMASLKVCLRLEDETPFVGAAEIRVIPEQGNELLGMAGDAAGEYLFSGITSGKYNILISAAGYPGLQLSTRLDGGPRQKMLFVPMRQNVAPAESPKGPTADPMFDVQHGSAPATARTVGNNLLSSKEAAAAKEEPPPAAVTEVAKEEAEPPAAANGEPNYWSPHELEEVVPPVDPAVACPQDALLHGVGLRMKEFVDTLEKFTATEKLEHFSVDRNGARKSPETRSFAYVVSVKQNMYGTFILEEFRDGNTDPHLFPASTATRGSPAMALIFHPALAGGFDFRCEGMGVWRGRQVWQVHFVQRPERPIQIRSYTVDGRSYGVSLEGRVWVDPGNDQVLRLESELVKPVEQIGLTREHFAIDYKPVQFHSTGQQLWLPQEAELYVERKGKRFYRKHLYSDFRLFNVDAAQSIRPPGESFSFTNTSDRDVSGELTVVRREGLAGDPVILRFVVPAHGKVFKIVGPGKDVNMPVAEVGAASFVHEGEPTAVKVDSHLLKESSLDIVPQTKLSLQAPPQPPAQPAPSPAQP
jgi:hypothetical protein